MNEHDWVVLDARYPGGVPDSQEGGRRLRLAVSCTSKPTDSIRVEPALRCVTAAPSRSTMNCAVDRLPRRTLRRTRA